MNSQKEQNGTRDETGDALTQGGYNTLRDLDRGWSWVVMLASFGGFCLIGASMNSIGIIHTALLDRYDTSVSTASLVCAVNGSLTHIGAPFCTYVIDRVSCRMAIILSGIFLTTGFFLTAFAPSIGVAIITTGVIAGLGASFGFGACLVVVSFNFNRYRNVVSGVALSGTGIGMFCLAPLIQMAKAHYGVQGFFIILAGISANIVTCGMLCFPSSLEIRTHKIRKHEMVTNKTDMSKGCSIIRAYLQTILNKAVLCMCLCMLIYHCGVLTILMFLPSFVRNKGLSPLQSSYILSMVGLASALGRIFIGIVATLKKFPDIVFYVAPLALVSISTFCLPLLPKVFTSYFIYSICMGFFIFGSFVVMSSVSLQYVPIESLATSIGLQLLFAGIGSLVGPVIAGILVEISGTVDIAFLFTAICCIVSFAVGLLLLCFKKLDGHLKQNIRDAEIEVF